MKIILKDKEYNLKITLRSYFVFEQITNHPFEIKTMFDNYAWMYSMLIANNKDCELTFDDFIDIMDDEPNKVNEFNEILQKENERFSLLNNKKDDSKGDTEGN